MSTTTNSEKVDDLPIVKALEFLVFTLGQEEYGMDIQKVQELRGYETVTHIVNAPEFIKGVVNLPASSCRSLTCASNSVGVRRAMTNLRLSSSSTSVVTSWASWSIACRM